MFQKQPSTNRKAAIIAVSVFIILLALFSKRTPEKVAANNTQPAQENHLEQYHEMYSVTAQSLNARYQANEVSADVKFKDQVIEVKGTVGQISKNAFDEIYITLNTGELLQEIHCTGLSEYKASRLHTGQTVAVQGKCKGLFMGSVVLEGCEIQ